MTSGKRKGHPIFAALYDLMSRGMEQRHLAQHRRDLIASANGHLLEIGAGTGANFAYYLPGLAVTATEPDPFMLRRAAAKTRKAQAQVRLVQAEAEALPFPEGTFDAVLSTLVLCSVADPSQALHEIRRVLRPGGRLLFYEHVRAETPRWQKFQDVITPLWKRLGAGCHPNRNTAQTIRQAGFDVTTLERINFGPYPAKPHIKGVAEKAGPV